MEFTQRPRWSCATPTQWLDLQRRLALGQGQAVNLVDTQRREGTAVELARNPEKKSIPTHQSIFPPGSLHLADAVIRYRTDQQLLKKDRYV